MSDWDAIVRAHGPMVYGTAWRILGHSADTEDVVQEVFLEAHRLESGHPVHCWPGLLRRMATFRALDRLRQRKLSCPLNDSQITGPDCDPEATAIGRELAERVRQAVAHLPAREGTVFCLRYFEDLSYQDIADHLGISPGAVAQALHKARAKLEVLLTEAVKGDLA